MNWGGIVASGIAGGATQAVDVAARGLETDRRVDAARQLADIDLQRQQRLAEFMQNMQREQQTYNTTGQGAGELLAFQRKGAEQTASLARENRIADLSNPALREAERKAKLEDAATARQATIEGAKDSGFLKAQWDTMMADPRVKAAYTAAMASAGASAAEQKLRAEQYAQLVKVGSFANQVRDLQTQLSGTNDPTTREALQQKITDLGFQGKDPAKFLSVAEKAQDNAAAALKVLADPLATDEAKAGARASLSRAVELSTKAAGLAGIKMDDARPLAGGPPPVGTEVSGFVFKGGNPNDRANWEPKKAAARAAGAAAATASGPAGIVSSQDTGLEGLSELALKRIAQDPSHPRSAAAKALLAQLESDRRQSVQAAMENADNLWPQ